MIVAYNALSVRPGVVDGAATYTINLLQRLPGALGDGHRLIAWLREGETRLDGVDGLEIRRVRLRAGAAGRIAFESLALRRDLRGVDVLLSPNESLPLRLPCPAVVVAQNLVYHQSAQPTFTGGTGLERLTTRAQFAYYRARMRTAYARAAAVVAVSNETRDVLVSRAGLDPRKAVVVLEGSDSVLLPDPGPERPRRSRLLVVSTLAPYKGLERTLELHAELLRRGHEVTLEIVGGDWRGYRAVLERRVAALGTGTSVVFHGGVRPAELVELYETSRLLLALSECESFGLPLVEAMRYGLPVVAARRSSIPEVVAEAAELLDESGDAGDRVEALLGDDATLSALAERGRRRAAELTWARAAAGVAAVLRDRVPGP